MQIKLKKPGFIAFTSLLVISAAIFAITVSAPLLGVTEANSSLGFYMSHKSLKLAESCTEEALLKLRDSATYTGETLNIAGGSCTISISGSGNNRTINVAANIDLPPSYQKNIQATVSRSGNSLNILTWQEN